MQKLLNEACPSIIKVFAKGDSRIQSDYRRIGTFFIDRIALNK